MASNQETAQAAIDLYESGRAASLSDAIAESLSGNVDFEKISRVCEEANTSLLRARQKETHPSELLKLSFVTAKPHEVAALLSVDPAPPVYKHADEELVKGPMKLSSASALLPRDLPVPSYPSLVQKTSSAPDSDAAPPLAQDKMLEVFDQLGREGLEAYQTWAEKASAAQARFVTEAEQRILSGLPRADVDYIVFHELQKYSSARFDMGPFAADLLRDLRGKVGNQWLEKQSAEDVARTLTPTLLGDTPNPEDLLVKLSSEYLHRMHEARRCQEALEHLLQRKMDYLAHQDQSV